MVQGTVLRRPLAGTKTLVFATTGRSLVTISPECVVADCRHVRCDNLPAKIGKPDPRMALSADEVLSTHLELEVDRREALPERQDLRDQSERATGAGRWPRSHSRSHGARTGSNAGGSRKWRQAPRHPLERHLTLEQLARLIDDRVILGCGRSWARLQRLGNGYQSWVPCMRADNGSPNRQSSSAVPPGDAHLGNAGEAAMRGRQVMRLRTASNAGITRPFWAPGMVSSADGAVSRSCTSRAPTSRRMSFAQAYSLAGIPHPMSSANARN